MFEFMAYLCPPDTKAPCRWRSSTTCSAKPTRISPPSMDRGPCAVQQVLRTDRQRPPCRALLTPCPRSSPLRSSITLKSVPMHQITAVRSWDPGIHFVGQHRRKTAQLFVCGDVKVVLSANRGDGTYIASVAVQVTNSAEAWRVQRPWEPPGLASSDHR